MSDITKTPSGMRTRIGIFGKTNAGKSSLLNMLTGQDAAIVSEIAGTTTDPVRKTMELAGLGPCIFVDTPGTFDNTELSDERLKRMQQEMSETDIALIVVNSVEDFHEEKERINWFDTRKIPVIIVYNRFEDGLVSDGIFPNHTVITVNAKTKQGKDALIGVIVDAGKSVLDVSLLGDMVKAGDTVMLVMPQDASAPKGRLILPQVMTTRELLDKHAIIISIAPEEMDAALSRLKSAPDLIITDSQVFPYVYERTPKESTLTSFSILMAGLKGDVRVFMEGAKAISNLTDGAKILIAESCTHAPLDEDIGRVKIPNMIRKKLGINIETTVYAGHAFPEDLSQYSLILQCGGCMVGRRAIMSRIEAAQNAGVPICNYGMAIAYLKGILDKVYIP